jgi:hypothetical protein
VCSLVSMQGVFPTIDDDYSSMTTYPWGISLLGGALVSSTTATAH